MWDHDHLGADDFLGQVMFRAHPNKKQISGALPDPSTPKCIPKGILVGNPPYPGLWLMCWMLGIA